MNVKAWIVGKLIANTALMTAIGGQTHLLPAHPGKVVAFPCLTYTEANAADRHFADDQPLATESVFTFDIYVSGGSTSAIDDALHTVMKGLFYAREFSSDVPDADLNVKHKTSRYRRTLCAEDLA